MALRGSLLAFRRPLFNPPAGLAPAARGKLAVMHCSRTGPTAAYSGGVPKAEVPTLALLGSDERFPVRRVYCVGSNYRCVRGDILLSDALSSFHCTTMLGPGTKHR